MIIRGLSLRVVLSCALLLFLTIIPADAATAKITSGFGNTFSTPVDQNVTRFIGSVQGTNYDWGANESVYQAYFRNNTNTARAVLYQKGGYYFIYDISGSQMIWKERAGQPAATSTLGGACSSNTLNTQAIVSGADVIYPLAFCNTNVTYTVNSSMLKENYILYGLPSIKDYLYLVYEGHVYFNSSLDICANDQCYRPSGTNDNFITSGQIDFRTPQNKTMFYLAPPLVRDSAGHTTVGSYNVHGSNAQMVFEVRVNQSFISTATFPIYIDPTVVDQEDKRVEFEPDTENFLSAQILEPINGTYQTSVNDVFVYFDSVKWKFGANDSSNTGMESYRYVINSSMGFWQKPNEPYAFYTSTSYKIDFSDICQTSCNITTVDAHSMYIDFTSDKFIDPYISPVPYSQNITYDLSATDPGNWIGASEIYGTTVNSTGAVYLGIQTGKFGVFIPPNNTIYDLSTTDPGDWLSTSSIKCLDVTPAGAVYVGTNAGKFGVYLPSTNTLYDLSNTDPGNWLSTSNLNDIVVASNGLVYIVADSGKIGQYNPATNITYDLSATDPGNWLGSSTLYGLSVNASGYAFVAGLSGKFGVYDPVTNITHDLRDTDIGNWVGTADLYSSIVNGSGAVFIGGATGKFGWYNPATNVTTDLSSTDPGGWFDNKNLLSMSLGSKGGVYLGINSGLYGVYQPNTNISYDLSTTDPGDWIGGTRQVNDIDADNTNGLVYLGIESGRFGVFSIYNSVGSTCTNNSQCDAACVDGYCCDTVCSGACERCSGSAPSWLGTNGTCSAIAATYDPDAECGAVQCDDGGSPPYFFGWSSLTCYYRTDVSAADAKCSGASSCYANSYYCPSQSQDGSTGTTCNCVAAQIGCSGTTAGSCNNAACGTPDVPPSIISFTLNQTTILQGNPLLATIVVDNGTTILQTLYIQHNGTTWYTVAPPSNGSNQAVLPTTGLVGNYSVFAFLNNTIGNLTQSPERWVYVYQKSNGDSCSAGGECSSGFCADGVCCNSACGGTCQRCDLAGSNGTCTNTPNGFDFDSECPGAFGACAATTCDGTGQCGYLTSECRASAGSCDIAEVCPGNSYSCPADAFNISTTLCRSSTGMCDVDEFCTGSSATCPTDAFNDSSTVCRSSAGVCDTTELCTGSSGACPIDSFNSSSTVCRAAAGSCDAAENCPGDSASCPSDSYLPAGEQSCAACSRCDGSSPTCQTLTNDTQDTEGTNVCSSTCKKCSGGSCVNQGNEDLFSQCGTANCGTGLCQAGNGVCDWLTSGEGNCATCQTCDGATSTSCEVTDNHAQDTQGSNTCTSTCRECNGAGSCVDQGDGQDYFSQCGSIECDGGASTPYYWGFFTDATCYYRSDVSALDARCDGTGSCHDDADYCPTQSMDGSSGTSCDCISAGLGCTGTTSGSCNNTLCSGPSVYLNYPANGGSIPLGTYVGFNSTGYEGDNSLENVTVRIWGSGGPYGSNFTSGISTGVPNVLGWLMSDVGNYTWNAWYYDTAEHGAWAVANNSFSVYLPASGMSLVSWSVNQSYAVDAPRLLATLVVNGGTDTLDKWWFTVDGTPTNISSAVNGSNNLLWITEGLGGNKSVVAYVNNSIGENLTTSPFYVMLKKTIGKTCASSAECSSGYCADGVCCNTACLSTCKRCDLAGSNGTCTNTPSGEDFDGECSDNNCGTGNCDGDGFCGWYTSGERNCDLCETCDGASSTSCVEIDLHSQDNEGSDRCESTCKECDGNGNCVNQDAGFDFFTQCDDINCGAGASTPYYWGWDALSCHYRDNVSSVDAKCDGTGSCYGASHYCPTQAQDGETGTACNCTAAQMGCSGTTAGSCNDGLCATTTTTTSTTTTTLPPTTTTLGGGTGGGYFGNPVYANVGNTTETTIPEIVGYEIAAKNSIIEWLFSEAWHSEREVFGGILSVKYWMILAGGAALFFLIAMDRNDEQSKRRRWMRGRW